MSCRDFIARIVEDFRESLCLHSVVTAVIVNTLVSTEVFRKIAKELLIKAFKKSEVEFLHSLVQDVIVLAGLLHDVGKAAFQRLVQGRDEQVEFRGHEVLSAAVAHRLWQVNMDELKSVHYVDCEESGALYVLLETLLVRPVLLHHQALRGVEGGKMEDLTNQVLNDIQRRRLDVGLIARWLDHLLQDHVDLLHEVFHLHDLVLKMLRNLVQDLEIGTQHLVRLIGSRRCLEIPLVTSESITKEALRRIACHLLVRYVTGIVIMADNYAVYAVAKVKGVGTAKRLIQRETEEFMRAVRAKLSEVEEIIRKIIDVCSL